MKNVKKMTDKELWYAERSMVRSERLQAYTEIMRRDKKSPKVSVKQLTKEGFC